MSKYKDIYYEFFGYDKGEFIPCEISGAKSDDLHHIDCRKIGGSKLKDNIENLIAVTREEHVKYGDKKQYMLLLYETHLKFIRDQNPRYKINWENIPQAYRESLKLTYENDI